MPIPEYDHSESSWLAFFLFFALFVAILTAAQLL